MGILFMLVLFLQIVLHFSAIKTDLYYYRCLVVLITHSLGQPLTKEFHAGYLQQVCSLSGCLYYFFKPVY